MAVHGLRAIAWRPTVRRQYRDRRYFVTDGVAALAPGLVSAAIAVIARFEWFERTSYLSGEHEAGTLTVCGQQLTWQVKRYDRPTGHAGFGACGRTTEVRVVTLLLLAEANPPSDHPALALAPTPPTTVAPTLTSCSWAHTR